MALLGRTLSERRLAGRGFTLIELMVAVAVVAILAAIAWPAYSDYVKRGKLVDATNGLSNVRALMERHYQDNRTYLTANSVTTPCDATEIAKNNTGNFTFACSGLAATTYTVTATGTGVVSGFSYSINQDGTMATVSLPTGWGSAASGCWITRKGGTC